MTNGGESGYGRIMKPETIQKLKNRIVTDKMLKSLNRTGKKHKELSKLKMRNNIHGSAKKSIEVIIDGITYNSYNEASRSLGIPLTTLHRKYKKFLK